MAKYDVKKTIWKGIKYAVFYGVPMFFETLLKGNPGWASVTLGSLITMGVNWLKHRRK